MIPMPFGLGPWGWGVAYLYPQWWNPFWCGYQPGSYPYYGTPWAPYSKEVEIRMLEDQARNLKGEIEAIDRRLEELKK
ncbi:MAG: DUF5320 domain-containing protein [Deltaproteobacteria bacterium]|nr:DUF5320 domain-containing protein [Deltaproteobacteria bacterium]